MKPFKNLSATENDALLRLPVYISLLAANGDGKLDDEEKLSAIKLSHIKSFSGEPLLAGYYNEADKVFEVNLVRLDKELPQEKGRREAAIKWELMVLDRIILKLGKKNASTLRRSMNAFKEHVSKAHHNVLVDFILPLPIPGLTE